MKTKVFEMKTETFDYVSSSVCGRVKIEPIGHFRVALNLIMKARLCTKRFMGKLVLFAYEWQLIFI